MSEVVRSVQQVTDIMGEIASASSEQTKGIEQVNVAVTQMDEVTQQNAALVERGNRRRAGHGGSGRKPALGGIGFPSGCGRA